jgi:membrane protease YdiL (CAAX protease family)
LDFNRFSEFPLVLVLAASAVVGVSAVSYLVPVVLLGQTYEDAMRVYDLTLFSNVVFAVAGLVMMFLKNLRGSLIVNALSFVVVLAFVEEVLLNSALAWYGLALAFLYFVSLPLVGIALSGKDERIRVVFEVCGLLFALRIGFSPFPINLLDTAAFLPAIYTLIMSGALLYIWFRKIPLGKIGLSRGTVRLPFQVLAGIGVGAVLGLVEHFVLRPKPVEVGSDIVSNVLYLVVAMVVFVGVTEELLFRGLLQSYMVDLMPKWQAVHLTSLIFGLFHTGWLNPMEVVFAYSAGIVFGYLLIKTNGLTAPILAHGFGNIMLYMVAQWL